MKFFLLLFIFSVFMLLYAPRIKASQQSWWDVQSIDTMKYSRDPSRQYLNNQNMLNSITEQQIRAIAETGATHVAIATPYDEEFLPVLKVWVETARKYHLHVWFRGNWSGWEGWFGYPSITRDEHFEKTKTFIVKHSDLFEDGDIFSACPECENGGPGDPRQNGDTQGHRDFLIKEYIMMNSEFKDIGKNVQVNFNSMNKDVADLIMDKQTTQALGGLVVIDHYVESPEQLNADISKVASQSGGKVILGEFGAPIPDIHGTMTDNQQAEWIKQSLHLLSQNENLVGINYWTNMGGSTSIWDDKGNAKPAVAVLQSYFTPKVVVGTVFDTVGNKMDNVSFQTDRKVVLSENGSYQVPYLVTNTPVTIQAQGYQSEQLSVSQLVDNSTIVLNPVNPNLWYRFRIWLNHLFQ